MAPRIELSTGSSSYQSDNNRPHHNAITSNMSSRIYEDDDDEADNVGQSELASSMNSESSQELVGHSNDKRTTRRSASAATRINRYTNLGRQRFGTAYHCMVAGSVLIYWLFVSVIPVYNKHYFQQTLYPYPIATAGIQLGVVSLLLALLNSVQHYVFPPHQPLYQRRISSSASARDGMGSSESKIGGVEDECRHSWIFGPHFWWKVKWCFPIGALFGLKYGCTNLGLHLVPAPTHLLLQSTDLVWTVLGAWWINGEVVSVIEMFCLGTCVVGSMVLGWQLEESSLAAPVFAIVVNLISPMLLGVCLATLRLACTELMRPDNRVGGTVSAVELTAIKLIVSSAVGLALACIMEGGDETKPSWWAAFFQLAQTTRWGVMGGAILISVFQVNCTFLTFLTSAVVLGLVGQVKIIPQWLLAAFSASRTSNFKIHSMNSVGAFLIMASAGAFALSNWLSTSTSTQQHTCECDVDVIHCDCNHHHHHHHHPGDDTSQEDDDDEEHGIACMSASTIGGPYEGDNNMEGKPLLMLGDAGEWGAAYLRKNYSAFGDNSQGIIGCVPNVHSEREPLIPLLTTPATNSSSTSAGMRSSRISLREESQQQQHHQQERRSRYRSLSLS